MDVKEIRIDAYDYPLPDERIARHPLAQRDRCKLLVAAAGAEPSDRIFADLPALLPSDAMLVYNNTRVINARLRFRKDATPDGGGGALIEIFCLEPHTPADYAVSFATTERSSWLSFVGNSKKWKEGVLQLDVALPGGDEVTLRARRLRREGNASIVEFSWGASCSGATVTFSEIIGAAGEIPIPPYLNRNTEQTDTTDYQTVFSHIEGSVAAPTAGLHFTDAVLEAIDRRGIPRREVTLHVGAGTFQPVKSDTIGEHPMHSEFIAVGRQLIEELADTPRKIFAVGTTSVRTLESLYHLGCLTYAAGGAIPAELPQWYPYDPSHPRLSRRNAFGALADAMRRDAAQTLTATTRLMIAPDYRYSVVDGIVTNFHQPRSTLLLLVSAFIGQRWRELYDQALAGGYRFLSYGDAMLLLR